MGTICAQTTQKEQCNQTVEQNRKNLVHMQGSLAQNISVDLVFGNYKQCRGESLLVIIQSKNLQHCNPLRDYTDDCFKIIELIQNMHKTFFKPAINKLCPYKQLMLCILPNYRSEESEQYKELFVNVLRQALEGVTQLVLEFHSTIEGIHNLPNQLLIGLILEELIASKSTLKLNLITTQKKLMSFYRYELMKTERFTANPAKY